MKQSIEEKISYRLLIIGLLSMLVTAIVCTAMFHRALTKQVLHDLSINANDIAAAYPMLPGISDLSRFGGEDIRITLIASDGTVLYENQAEGELENHLSRPEIQKALDSGEGWDERTSASMGYNTYYYAIRLEDGNILRVALDARDISSNYSDMLPLIVISCIIILGLSAVVSILLTRRLVRPIESMADNLDDISNHVPYRELEPFARAIQIDQQSRKSSERLRREFTANVSHELKTPLTSISGYAELIQTGMAKPDDVKGFAAKIRKESARLLTLIGDIIKLSELDSADGEPQLAAHFEQVDLMEVAKECVSDLQLTAQKAYITILAQGSSALVQADRGLLMELCTNLCDNAIRYNRAGGKVTVTVETTPEGASLTVQDTGIGIPPEHQQRVFERFYRVDKSRSKATGGTGLGLAIVKHIAMLHGAKLTLESEEGKGTTIRILFVPRKA